MPTLDPFSLAITIFVLGIVLWAAVLILRRAAPHLLSSRKPSEVGSAGVEAFAERWRQPESPGESGQKLGGAVLVVLTGGRVAYLSAEGREWFGSMEEQPNLERLARRAKPVEAFLRLCAAPVAAHFTLSGQVVEAESYAIPYDGSQAMLVCLRRLPRDGEADEGDRGAFQRYAALSRLLAPGPDQEMTVQAVQDGLERLLAGEMGPGPVWPEDVVYGVALALPLQIRGEADKVRLVPYRPAGLTSAVWSWGSELGELVAAQRKTLRVGESTRANASNLASNQMGPGQIVSYLGVPLLASGELVGTLEMASYSKDAFTAKHQEVLEAFAGQAALALHNARLAEAAQRLAAEQAGLARLARAAEAPGGIEPVCRRLVEGILPLLEVEGLGFWLWDESAHCLKAIQPFLGFSTDFTDLYSAPISPGSPGEALLRSGETILAAPATEDARLKSLGLDLRAQAAGFESTLLVPLTAGGRRLGYLQAADKKNGTPFDAQDMRLLAIIASQAAAALDRGRELSATIARPVTTSQVEVFDTAWVQDLARTGGEWTKMAASVVDIGGLRLLLQRILDDFCRLTHADCGSLLLLHAAGDRAAYMPHDGQVEPSLAMQVGEAHPGELSTQERAALEPQTTLSAPPVVTLEYPEREFRAGEKEAAMQTTIGSAVPHAGVRSALLVPVAAAGSLAIALVHLHALRPEAFGPVEVQAAISLAAIAAGALAGGQALLQANLGAQEQAQRLAAQAQRFAVLHAAAQSLSLDQPVEAGLEGLARALVLALQPTGEAVDSERVQINLVDVHHPGWDEVLARLRPEYRLDLETNEAVPAYFLPAPDGTDGGELVLPLMVPATQLSATLVEDATPNAGQPDLPLTSGIIRIDLGKKPERTTWEAAQFLAGEARRWLEAQGRQAGLQRQLSRLKGAAQAVPSLLRKDLEAGLSISRLSSRLRWMQAGLELAEAVSQAEGRAGVLRAVAEGLVARLDFDAALVAEPNPDGSGPRLVEQAGRLPAGANPPALLGQFNPLRVLCSSASGATFLHAADLQTPALSGTSDWQDSPLLQALQARSFVGFAIPVPPGQEGSVVNHGVAAIEAAVLAVRGELDPILALQTTALQTTAGASVGEDVGAFLETLFALLSGQVAVALGAQRLRAETARRMQEVNLLLEFSRQLGSLDPRHLLETLLASTRRLVPAAQAGCVACVEYKATIQAGQAQLAPPLQTTLELVPIAAAGYADQASALALHYPVQGPRSETGVVAQAWRTGRPLRRDEVDFARDVPLAPQDLAHYRDATAGKLPVSSLVVPVPRSETGEPAGILVLENFSSPAAFSAEDEALVLSLARQTALALDAARLYQAAEGRLVQLQTLTQAAARLTSRLDTSELIDTLLVSARAVVPYDTGTLWLRPRSDTGAERLLVRAARGFEDREDRVGLSVVLAESRLLREMIPSAARQGAGQAILVPDVRQDARFPAIMAITQPKYLSWLGVPLIAQGELIGVIALEKAEAYYYTPEQVQALMAFASQAAAALENARLYEESLARAAELDRRSTRLALLNRLSTELSTSLDATFILQLTLQELLLAVGAAGGSALLFDAAGEVLLQAELPTGQGELPVVLPPAPLYDHLRQTLGVYSLSDISASGVADNRGSLADNGAGAPNSRLSHGSPLSALGPLEQYLARRGAHGLLVLPLVTGSDLHGLLLIHHSVPHTFTPEEVELARTISNQAAVAVQNASLFQETQWLFAETRQRSAELATLFDLGVHISQVLDREKLIELTFENILHLMAAGSHAGSQVDGSRSSVEDNEKGGAENESVLSVGLVMQSEEGELIAQALEKRGPDLWQRIGPLPLQRWSADTAKSNPELQTNLVGQPGSGTTPPIAFDDPRFVRYSQQVLSSGQPLLISDILPESFTATAGGRGAWLGVPLVVRGAVTGVLAAQSSAPGFFTESHLRLLAQIGNQLAVALDNARLFAAVQGYASELEQRVASRSAELTARTDQLAREHQRTQTLLGIITELSTSLDMDIVLNRTLALINETIGATHSMILLVLPDESNLATNRLFLRATLGYPTPLPKGGQPTALRWDEGLAGWAISHRQPAMISNLVLQTPGGRPGQTPGSGLADDEVVYNAGMAAVGQLPGTEQHRSAIAMPLMIGEETLGALLLFHDEPGRFSASQLDLVQATAKQIAVAINNAQLYTLIRDQAERLGDMLRRQHIETSRSQAILEAVADGVLVTDANRVITLFNASAGRILGLQREAVIGQSLEQFLGLFGKAGQAWMDTILRWSEDPSSIAPAEISDSGQAEEEAAPYTAQIELEDLRVVSVHLSPVRLRSDFLGTVSTFRDITHQVVVDRLKSEFVATVSHELRTPMTSIKGYVEILLMGAAGQLSDQQTRFLEIVRANTERLAVLVNDLLDISRIEAGRVMLSLQPLDMRQLAHEAVTDLERRNAEDGKGMHFQLVLPGQDANSGAEFSPRPGTTTGTLASDRSGLPRVLGDAERVHQILDNLLDNAYSYTPAGGYIILRLSHTGDEVQVEVQDNGIGIHPEDQPRIFERFYRGENPLVLATSGTGLGLSIVRHLVEMHNGRIWLKSNGIPGEGSTFTFTLPVYQP